MAGPGNKQRPGAADDADAAGPPIPDDDADGWASAAEEWEAEMTVDPAGEDDITISGADPGAEPVMELGQTADGALPTEENPFGDTPATVPASSLGPLGEADVALPELPALFADDAAADDLVTIEFGDVATSVGEAEPVPEADGGPPMPFAPAPGAPFVVPDAGAVRRPTAPTPVVGGAAVSLFVSEPPPDAPVASLSEPLPEMAAEIWQAGVRALVNVAETVEDAGDGTGGAAPTWPTPDYWADLARLYLDELGVADTAASQVEATLAAAHVMEQAGDPAAALGLCDDALTLEPDQPEALRARARLSEATGDVDGAHAAWARLAVAASGDEERGFYAALAAEWTLARSGSLPPEGLESIPDGPARCLAAAEGALLHGTPLEVAAALEQAAFMAGGAVGGALLDAAARFYEVGGDAVTAAERRFVAAQMEPGAGAVPLGRLRDAARGEAAAAEELLGEVLPALASSALGGAAARWAARLARQRGDAARAGALVADAAAPDSASILALRDQVDGATAAGQVPDDVTLERTRAALGWPAAEAALVASAAAARARAGDVAGALALLKAGAPSADEARTLHGILARELADELNRRGGDAEARIAALQIAVAGDPGRRATAARALAQELAARAQAARAGAPAGQGDAEGAAGASPPDDHEAAIRAAVQASLDAAPGSMGFWGAAVRDARAGRADDAAATVAAGATRWGHSQLAAAIVAETAPRDPSPLVARLDPAVVLPRAPAHPVALALVLGDPDTSADDVTGALWAAGERAEARRLRLDAVLWAALSPPDSAAAGRALTLAQALHASDPSWAPARALLARLARAAPDAAAGARVLGELVPAPASPGAHDDAAAALVIGEALESAGDGARAAAVLRPLVGGRFGADAGRALARLGAMPPAEALPLDGFARPADAEVAETAAALARLDEAAREGRWPDAVDALEGQGSASAAYAAALLAEGRGDGARAQALLSAALVSGAGTLAVSVRAGALAAAASALGPDAGADVRDVRSAATFLVMAADARAADGDAEGAGRCLAEAVTADPQHLPAALGARRAAARRGDAAAASEACEHEAGVLVVPEARVEALLLAAALAARGSGPAAPVARARAVTLLRRALEIDPPNETAFERLRALLGEAGDHAGLAAALLARIEVARNPFELTALRIARAELLTGPLGDRAAAKAELATILAKEPQHARALARLGDLEYEDAAHAEAGELYVRRAVVERSTPELREVLLRIGRIYTLHVPEPKRAVSAYERVLQIEPDNHEALAVLSDLYFTAGETKSALGVTERLAGLEPDPARRLAALVRSAQLWERTGDLRQAGARFRRAADEAPRDATAVTELARFLERTRDLGGRRALLDHAAGLLRHDVERGKFDVGSLRTLIPLLQARGKPHAAAAAAQLVGLLSPDEHDREAAAGWAAPPPRGRRLAALATPELDERSFPSELPPGVRHVFRLAGPLLGRGGPDLARAGVARNDRVGRGQPPRDTIDAVATELGVRDVDVYLAKAPASPSSSASASSPVLRIEPGSPAAIIVGAGLLKLGGRAVRFAAARSLRLVATHLDLVLAATPEEAGALLGGVVRQFVPEYRHPQVRDELLEVEAERMAKHLPRKLKQELMPFAVESAGAFDLGALHAAVRDGANAAGLLAAGDLPAALAVVLATRGRTAINVDNIAADPEALALLRFALSDDYDAMAEAMG